MKKITGKTLWGEDVEISPEKLQWRPGVYAIILNDNRELLVQDIPTNNHFALPGGGVELWEPIPQALRREVWEETGLEIEIGALAGIADEFFQTPSGKHWHTINMIYHTTAYSGQLRNSILEDEISTNPHWQPVTPELIDHLQVGSSVLRQVFGF